MIQIELPKEVQDALEASAKSKNLSPSEIVSQAISGYLELEQWQEDEVKKPLKEADQKEFASEEEVSTLFQKWRIDAT